MWPLCGFPRNHGIQLADLSVQADFHVLGHCAKCTHLTFLCVICPGDLYEISIQSQVLLNHLRRAKHGAGAEGIKETARTFRRRFQRGAFQGDSRGAPEKAFVRIPRRFCTK